MYLMQVPCTVLITYACTVYSSMCLIGTVQLGLSHLMEKWLNNQCAFSRSRSTYGKPARTLYNCWIKFFFKHHYRKPHLNFLKGPCLEDPDQRPLPQCLEDWFGRRYARVVEAMICFILVESKLTVQNFRRTCAPSRRPAMVASHHRDCPSPMV